MDDIFEGNKLGTKLESILCDLTICRTQVWSMSDNTFVFNNLYFYIFQTWGFLLLCQFFYIYKEYLQMSEGETMVNGAEDPDLN